MSGLADAGGPAGRTRAALQDLHVLGLLTGLSVLFAAWSYPVWSAAVSIPCVFRELTGIPCPTCYGTRALLAASGGRWLTALRLNPMVGAGSVGLMVYLPWAAGTVAGDWPRPRLSQLAAIRLVRFGMALALLNWAYLIAAHGVT